MLNFNFPILIFDYLMSRAKQKKSLGRTKGVFRDNL